MTRVLIIGSKGFIGAALHRSYSLESDVEVWGCDVVTDYPASRYFLIDAVNSNYEEVFSSLKFDICINCSGAASVPDSIVHPLRDYYLNTKNVISVLESIRKYCPECRFLNLSSAAVYGNPSALPIKEEHDPRPLSPYGWHKYQSEILCREFFEVYGLRTCSARIFSAYGIGLRKQLLWDWFSKIRQSDEVILFGTGDESRDFIYIDDVVAALKAVALRSPFCAEVINVANGKEIFIKDAIRVFKQFSKKDFGYRFSNEVRKGDPLNWVADIGKLTSLGYEQTTSLEDGVRSYLNWLDAEK